MKNSRQYSENVHKLYRRLKSEYAKPQKVQYNDILQAMVYAIISEHNTIDQTECAFRRLSEYFVDFNELRLSQTDEIAEVLGQDTALAPDIASRLTAALGSVFNMYNTVSLETLRTIGKRQAKQVLAKVEAVSDFVVDYCMLTSLAGHAIPLTAKTTEYLKKEALVHPQADQQEIQGFLTRQIPAKDAYQFYALLRAHTEPDKTSMLKKKTVRKPKTTKRAKT